MTNKSNDWRLTSQENYLKNVKLIKRKYRQYNKNPEWTHDHCAFCWETFSLTDEKALKEGYTTIDDYHWICEVCFNDFREMFNWELIKE